MSDVTPEGWCNQKWKHLKNGQHQVGRNWALINIDPLCPTDLLCPTPPYSVYPGGGTMVAKILDIRLSENLKIHSPGPFALSNYPCLESWIFHCRCKNFPWISTPNIRYMYLFSTLLTKRTQIKKIKSFSQNFFTLHHICSNFDALDKKIKIYIVLVCQN